MQATDVSVINNYSEGEVIKDMFEIKRANEILLSENDVTQDVLDKLEKGEDPKPTIPGKSGYVVDMFEFKFVHFARSEIMPVNKAYNIQELLEACRYYIDRTGRRITFEYAVISGVNSSDKDADRLSDLLRGINCHVNLIPVNKVKERDFHTASSAVAEFAKRLGKRGINATVRRTLGSDIEAACGQLRRDAAKKDIQNGGADA